MLMVVMQRFGGAEMFSRRVLLRIKRRRDRSRSFPGENPVILSIAAIKSCQISMKSPDSTNRRVNDDQARKTAESVKAPIIEKSPTNLRFATFLEKE